MTDRKHDPERVSLAFIWDTASPRFSRRSFMRTMAFASAAGFLAACGSSSKTGSSSSAGSPGTTVDVHKTEAKLLNFYNWTDYIDDDTIPNFQKETGIKVRTTTTAPTTSSSRRCVKVSRASTSSCRPTPSLVKMKHADLIEKLDLSAIPNVVNLDPRFRNAAYDPGNQYSIPWQWGTTGIGFDKTKVGGDVTDWDAFKLPAIKGKCSYLDEARDAFAMALFAMNKDPNTLNTTDLDDATQTTSST